MEEKIKTKEIDNSMDAQMIINIVEIELEKKYSYKEVKKYE